MYSFSIRLTSITAEKLAEIMPQKIQFQINLTLPSSQPYRRGAALIVPFVFSVSTVPPTVQITLKGEAHVTGSERGDISGLEKDLKNKKIPQPIFQAVFHHLMAEVIVLSRSLGVPPPIPLPPLPTAPGKQGTSKQGQTYNIVQ